MPAASVEVYIARHCWVRRMTTTSETLTSHQVVTTLDLVADGQPQPIRLFHPKRTRLSYGCAMRQPSASA
jgi:hypothetical protein